MSSSAIYTGIAAAILTPIVMAAWSALSPPSDLSKYDEMGEDVLYERNNRFDVIGHVLAVVGICIVAALMNFGWIDETVWWLGLAFGSIVIFPVSFISIMTLPYGKDRFREYWRCSRSHSWD